MTKRYVITPNSQYLNYSPFLWMILFVPIGTFFLIRKAGPQSSLFFICSMAGFCAYQLLGLLWIHMNYLHANKGDELICDMDTKKISYTHDGEIIEFSEAEITSVLRYLSYSTRDKKAGLSPFDYYNVMFIKLHSGKIITITSLLVPDINTFIQDAEIPKDKITSEPSVFFPFYMRRA